MKRMLVIRTDHDIGNRYLYAYTQNVIREAEFNAWQVNKVEKTDANKKNVLSRLTSNEPDFVFFNGHGEDTAIYGHYNEQIISVDNAEHLTNKITFIRSCSSLNALGKKAVEKGAKAVIGYRGEFIIARTNEYAATPLNDPAAKRVLEASNAIPLKIVRGGSVEEAVNASKKISKNSIKKLLTSTEPYDAATLHALFNNYLQLDFEGNPNARV